MAESTASTSSKKKSPIVPIAIGCLVLLLLVGGAITFGARFFGKQMLSGYLESRGVKSDLSDLEKGKMTFTDPKTGQTVEVGSQKLPDNFPSDFPQYPGAKVAGSVSGMQGEKGGFMVTFTTSDALDRVLAYYKDQMAKNGWEVKGSFNSNESQTWVVKKGDMEGTLGLSGEKDLTAIVVIIGTKSE